MKHQLRTYQRTACIEVCRRLGDNPLLVAPTGAGKTTMGVYLASVLRDRGVVWVAHRTELIDQAVARFGGHGMTAGIIQAGRSAYSDADVQVASVQTLARRPQTDAGIYIIDEAHRCGAESYRRCIPESSIRIGLTATPFRTDGRGLGRTFGHTVIAATTQELIDSGTLMNPEVWVIDPPDMAGVARRGGEYSVGQSAERVNTEGRRADIVKQWQQRCSGARTLAFAVNVEHSKAIAEAFLAAGVPAEHVDAETSADERADAIARLASGKTIVLSNVMLFTEGFDLPAVETLIVARPTDSLGLHLQMIGRCMRRADGKTRAVVHDHAGNHLRLGRVTQDISYGLDDTQSVTERRSEPLGLTMCSECFRLHDQQRCPECGHETPPEAAPEITGGAGMKELTEHDIREAAFDRLCEEQAVNNYKAGYIFAKFKEQFGEWPPVAEVESGASVYVNPDRADQAIKRAYYKTSLKTCVQKGWDHGAASHRYKDLFGCWPKGFVSEVKNEIELEQFVSAFESVESSDAQDLVPIGPKERGLFDDKD